MRIRLSELRRIIRSVILEAMPSREEVEKAKADAAKRDPGINRSATHDVYRANEEVNFQKEVDKLVSYPEYADVDAFITDKFDDEQTEFNTAELLAVSINVEAKKTGKDPKKMRTASQTIVDFVKAEILGYGLKFVPKKPLKNFRGSMSSGHGKHPFAGAGAGGSGAMAGGHIGLGRGPGAVGGGERSTWSSSDPRSFGMGARKKLL